MSVVTRALLGTEMVFSTTRSGLLARYWMRTVAVAPETFCMVQNGMKPRSSPATPGTTPVESGAGSVRVEPSAKYQVLEAVLTPSASWAPLTSPTSKLLMKYIGRSATKLADDVSLADTPVNTPVAPGPAPTARPIWSYTAMVVRWPAGTETSWLRVPWDTPAGSSSW